jgi:hypothetical protein
VSHKTYGSTSPLLIDGSQAQSVIEPGGDA